MYNMDENYKNILSSQFRVVNINFWLLLLLMI